MRPHAGARFWASGTAAWAGPDYRGAADSADTAGHVAAHARGDGSRVAGFGRADRRVLEARALQRGGRWSAGATDGEALAADQERASEIRAAPAADWERSTHWWSVGAVRRWNEIARNLIAGRHVNSGNSARILASLAVAQYDAAVVARRLAERFAVKTADPARLAELGRGPVEHYGYPSQEAAIAQASADVLSHFFTSDRAFLTQNELAHSQSRIWMGAAMPSDIEAGRAIGRAASAAAVGWLRADNFNQVNSGRVSEQPDKWFSEEQTFPGFGRIKPWTHAIGRPVPRTRATRHWLAGIRLGARGNSCLLRSIER